MGLHAAVIATLLSVKDSPPELPTPPEAIMVSLVEAPVPQQAKADEPTPEVPPPPQPPVQQPPPPPEPETKPDPTPDPTPTVEPDPEPEPVIEKPPEPAKPKPKPKPKPQPKPKSKPVEPKPVEPKPVEPKPVETPPPPAPAPPPSGTPQGATTAQAPRQGPPQDQPELVSSIAYDGSGPQAVYPMASQRLREEGRVMVLLLVSPQGTVEKVTVVSSSGYSRLDQAALDAFRRVHFKPYTRNGVAYPAQVKIPFDFKIRN